MIFDTHAHYDDKAFDADREQLLASFPEYGIGAVTDAASTYGSLAAIRALTERFPFLHAAYGIHPSEIDTVPGVVKLTSPGGGEAEMNRTRPSGSPEDLNPPSGLLEELRALCSLDKAVAVGEIGLDYHWDKDNKAQQQAWFRAQLALARTLDLPVIIHSRDAAEDTLVIAKQERIGEIGGVMHCYSYSVELARKYLNMGLYLGIGGVLTFKNARKLREVAAYAPMEQLVIETDCPYLAPAPHRGSRNDSRYLPLVVQAIADVKGMETGDVERITWENARRLYRI